MSIIYDALKKTQTKLKLPSDETKQNNYTLKFYIVFIFIVLIGCSYVLTTLLYSPAAVNPDFIKEIKTTASVEQKPAVKTSWIKSPLGNAPELELTGIVTMDNEKIALINGQMLKRGEYIEGAYVINILNDKVYLDLGGKPVVLKIK
ncbi:MAG: hypothetical protein FJZ11_03200 [Candidatus Omnitrophica bacterium]|nr:hypothetical protein [Candidatus Omnitrophota bacterium]